MTKEYRIDKPVVIQVLNPGLLIEPHSEGDIIWVGLMFTRRFTVICSVCGWPRFLDKPCGACQLTEIVKGS